MSEMIMDGTGKGYQAQVDEKNRLRVLAVGKTIAEDAAKAGDSYNINTGTITLTSASESGVLYLKNNGDNDVIVAQVGYLFGN